MSLSYTYDGAAVTHNAAPSGLNVTHRADGDKSFGGIPFEDPTATLEVVGHKLVTVEEDECAQPRLFTGFTTERGMGRSLDEGLFVGPNPRLVDMTVVDMNAALGFRQITGADGNRPAETWAERLTWILESDYLNEFISDDQTWIVTNTVSCEAADYRSAYPIAVLDDLVDRSGGAYVYFAFYDTTADEVRLFFDNDVEVIGACTLSISNVDADVDGATVFAPTTTSKLAREPDMTYSDVTVVYDRGAKKLYRYRPSTAAAYVRRGTEISRPYTRGLATATAQAEKWLDKHSVETDRITCSIQVPADSVGLIQAGQSIDVRFSHLPGYESASFTTMRIVSYSPKPTNDTGYWYDVALELVGARPAATVPSFLIAVRAEGRGTGDPLDMDGWTLAFDNDMTGMPDVALELGPPAKQGNSMWYRAVAPGEDADVLTTTPDGAGGCWIYEVAGVDINAITYVNDKLAVGDGVECSVTEDVGTTDSVLFGVISWQKVTYDYGWCDPNQNGTICTAGEGTPLLGVNGQDSYDSCDGDIVPWNFIAYDQGTGTLEISATESNGDNGGYNVARGALILPILSGATFSIVQSAFGGAKLNNQPYTVTLPAPPTGSATVSGGGDDDVTDLGPTPGATTTHTTDPTVDDDETLGYTTPGMLWVNTTSGEVFVLTDPADGAAVWTSTTASGSWAPTTVDYLVGTASGALSAEIVVGTTPGGELGGTWASPTVDATHAGSTHLALGSTSSTAAAGDHTHADIWRPLMDGAGNVVTDGATGEAIMALG